MSFHRFAAPLVMMLGAIGVTAALAQQPPQPPARPSQPMQLGPSSTSGGSAAAATPAASIKLDRAAAIERANAYLNSIVNLSGDFSQQAADGRRFDGRIYLAKPGRLRFEYKPPATVEIIADGTSVAIRDRKLATQDLYAIGQTPLKFLVKERLDLNKDMTILKVDQQVDKTVIEIEDKATFGGTSRIWLHFDPQISVLKRWIIRDPQGQETNVILANLDTSRRPDLALFKINYDKVIDQRLGN
jgi:outer membrane lipoprotein-sorting protein